MRLLLVHASAEVDLDDGKTINGGHLIMSNIPQCVDSSFWHLSQRCGVVRATFSTPDGSSAAIKWREGGGGRGEEKESQSSVGLPAGFFYCHILG